MSKYFSFFNRNFFLLLILVIVLNRINFSDSLFVSPSFYFTYGDYTNSLSSSSYAFYNTTQFSKRFFMINHYDNLSIKGTGWNYKQQSFLLGAFYNYFPFYFKINYEHLKGDYKLNSTSAFNLSSYNYSDYSNLYNVDFIFYQNLFYYGISYSHLNSIGLLNQDSLPQQSVNQFTFRFENIFSSNIYFSLKPNISLLEDGRKLYSIALKANYLLNEKLLFKAGGFIGKRAYYFDSDLLTIYNQYETQYYQIYFQSEYDLFIFLKITFSYQHTNFDSFSINYYIGGVKANLYF